MEIWGNSGYDSSVAAMLVYDQGPFLEYFTERRAARNHCLRFVKKNGDGDTMPTYHSPEIERFTEYCMEAFPSRIRVPILSVFMKPWDYDKKTNVFRFMRKEDAMVAKLAFQL